VAVPQPVRASGPLGLCNSCCAARKADPAHPLAEAVTLVPVPFTAGSDWGEWKTPGFEVNLPISGQFALCVSASTAGTATPFTGEIEYTE